MDKNKINFWKPVLSLFWFTSSFIFKKISIWITFAIFLLITFIVSISPVFFTKTNNNWNQDNYLNYDIIIIVVYSILIFSSTIIGILISLCIFKDSQKNGIEILILSKSINRKQILISRFLFLWLIIIGLSIINMIFIIFALLIDGFKNFSTSPTVIIFGSFLATFLPLLFFSIITLCLSTFFSSILSSMLPIILLISSLIIAMIGSISNTLSYNNNLSRLQSILINKLNEKIKNNTLEYEDYEGNKIKEFSYYSYNDLFTLNNNGYITYKTGASIQYRTDECWIFCPFVELDGSESNNKELANKIKNDIDDMINSISLSASKSVIKNYLNPINAFASILDFNSIIWNYSDNYSKTIPNNFSLYNIKRIDNNDQWLYSYNSNQADPQWAVAITWVSIIAIISILSSYSYVRKDFK